MLCIATTIATAKPAISYIKILWESFMKFESESVMERSRVPSRPAGRDPGRDQRWYDPVSRPVPRDGIRDGTGFFKGIFEKTRPTEDF